MYARRASGSRIISRGTCVENSPATIIDQREAGSASALAASRRHDRRSRRPRPAVGALVAHRRQIRDLRAEEQVLAEAVELELALVRDHPRVVQRLRDRGVAAELADGDRKQPLFEVEDAEDGFFGIRRGLDRFAHDAQAGSDVAHFVVHHVLVGDRGREIAVAPREIRDRVEQHVRRIRFERAHLAVDDLDERRQPVDETEELRLLVRHVERVGEIEVADAAPLDLRVADFVERVRGVEVLDRRPVRLGDDLRDLRRRLRLAPARRQHDRAHRLAVLRGELRVVRLVLVVLLEQRLRVAVLVLDVLLVRLQRPEAPQLLVGNVLRDDGDRTHERHSLDLQYEMQTSLGSVKKSRDQRPPSRPRPLIPTPPNG